MKKLQLVLSTLLLVTISFCSHAQDKIIKSDFYLKKNISGMFINQEKGGMVDANKSYAEFRVFDFGDEGTTVILSCYFASTEGGKGEKLEFAWSGKNIALGYGTNENAPGYMVMYGNRNCGMNALFQANIGGTMCWILSLDTNSPEGSHFLNDELLGISVDALRAMMVEQDVPGRLSGGQRMGEYMVYELLSIGSQKRYKSGGDYYYGVNANTPYARYYFKNGKLEKWLYLEK